MSSGWLNHPELMSHYPLHRLPQSNGGSRRFEGVEPSHSHLEPTRLMSNYPEHQHVKAVLAEAKRLPLGVLFGDSLMTHQLHL